MQTDSEILRSHERQSTFRVVPLSDWRAILRRRINVLVIGPPDALAAFGTLARSEMRAPITSIGASLPSFLGGVRTLILTDAASLDGAQQQRLLTWLDDRRDGDVQVISLTSTPLFPLVETKVFDPQLYYRLNTVLLEIQSA